MHSFILIHNDSWYTHQLIWAILFYNNLFVHLFHFVFPWLHSESFFFSYFSLPVPSASSSQFTGYSFYFCSFRSCLLKYKICTPQKHNSEVPYSVNSYKVKTPLQPTYSIPEAMLMFLCSHEPSIPRGNHYSDLCHHKLVLLVFLAYINRFIQYAHLYAQLSKNFNIPF